MIHISGTRSHNRSAREVRENLELFQARLDAVLNCVSEAICIVDEKGSVVAWNRAAEAMYNVAAKEIIGRNINSFVSDALLNQVLRRSKEVLGVYHEPREGLRVLFKAHPVRCGLDVRGAVSAERESVGAMNLHPANFLLPSDAQAYETAMDKTDNEVGAFENIHGRSESIRWAVGLARKVSGTTVPVVISGESGTGKELFARSIHEASGRKGAFIAINCGTMSANMFESELFGCETGATAENEQKENSRLMELADKGTLFFDEIGDISKEVQIKLLRTLQNKVFVREGKKGMGVVDVQIISATNRNLQEMVGEHALREDLYYRLNVVPIALPPLRDRREDIPDLIYHGIKKYANVYSKRINRLSAEAMEIFLGYNWPGNVRELYNVLERVIVLTEGQTIGIENMPLALMEHQTGMETAGNIVMATTDLNEATRKLERQTILRALQENGYNKAAAARDLCIPRSTLYYKMSLYAIKEANDGGVRTMPKAWV